MNRKNIILMVIAIITLLSFVVLAAYAYFTGTVSVNNKANVTASTERNNMVFDTVGGAMSLNVTATNMQRSQIGLAAQNSTTLTVNFQANTSYSMVCTYDIIYEWTSNSSNRYTTHSNGVTGNEFTIQASLASNAHVYEGANSIKNETDLSTAVGNHASATVVSGAQIDGTGSTTNTAVWTISSKFYNVNANQSGLANKSYQGRFKVANVSCVAGTVTSNRPQLTYFWSHSFIAPGVIPNPHYDSGTSTGHSVYIGSTGEKHYVCSTYQSHEVCFSEPYTQYGLEDHTANVSFNNVATNGKTYAYNAKMAILEVFNNLGINMDASNCNSSDSVAYCVIDNITCAVEKNGSIYCKDSIPLWGDSCKIFLNSNIVADGSTYCDDTE